MARIRTLKPDLWEDEALGSLSRDVRLLFIGLISHADDEGRQRGSARVVSAKVFPFDDDVEAQQVEDWLAELAAARLVMIYHAGGQRFIQVRNWTKHQKVQHPRESSFPAPPSNPSIEPEPATGPEPLMPIVEPSHEPLMNAAGEGQEPLTPDEEKEGDKDKEGKTTTSSELDVGSRQNGKPPSSVVDDLFAYWQEQCNHTKTTFSPERRRAVQKRLDEGATPDEIRTGIDGAAKAPYVGENGVEHDDLELICRNRSKLDSFIKRATAEPKQTPHSQLETKDAIVLKRALVKAGLET